MLIREWTSKDNLRITELEKLCFEFPWTYEMIEQTQSQKNFFGVVAQIQEQVVGYAGAIYSCDTADVALVAVDPNYRKQGIGESIVNALIAQLIKIGIKSVFLEVRASNEPAKALYAKCGFVPVGVRKRYYENAEDAIVMIMVIGVE